MKRGPKPKSREGQKPGTLVCIKCKQESPQSNFYKDKNRPNGRYPECKPCVIAYRKLIYKRDWDRIKEGQRRYNRKNRKLVLDHYGHKCACCGETRYEFLAVDHINGGGLKHRKEVLGGATKGMSLWLIKNNFPPEFRLLCHNCNNARGWYGYCPHETKPPDDYWDGI